MKPARRTEVAQREMALLLTPRERDVVLALANGHTVPTAAGVIGITYGTARTHLDHAMKRLGVHCRADLVRFVVRHKAQLVATVDTTPAMPAALAELEAHDLATIVYAARARAAHKLATITITIGHSQGARMHVQAYDHGVLAIYREALAGAKSVTVRPAAPDWITDTIESYTVEAVRPDNDVLVTFTLRPSELILLGLKETPIGAGKP